MIKMIVSDLDGTLVPKGTQEMNPKMYELIREMKEKGILFVSASGRQIKSQRLLFAPVAEEISYIAENGALCFHEGKCIHQTQMKPETVEKIFRVLEKMPTCKAQISCPRGCYVKSGDPAYLHHVRDVLNYETFVTDDFHHLPEPVIKIAVLDNEDFETSLHTLQAMTFEDMTVEPVGNNWIDFIPTYSNKGTALQALLERLQIRPEECVAFGDYQNDIQMLQVAGVSYAMEDGTEGAKAAADFLTKDVAQTIRELLDQR